MICCTQTASREAIEAAGRRMIVWLQEQGGFVGPINITAVRRGDISIRGLVAATDIPANTTILRVPRSAMLVGDDVDHGKWRNMFELGGYGRIEYDILLAIRILEEKAKGEVLMCERVRL